MGPHDGLLGLICSRFVPPFYVAPLFVFFELVVLLNAAGIMPVLAVRRRGDVLFSATLFGVGVCRCSATELRR